MNVVRLNDYLSDNVDAIITILEELGCDNIKFNSNKNEIRCSREPGKNPSAVKINTSTLRFNCFSTGENGSIYNLVMNKRQILFPQALRWIAKLLDISEGDLVSSIRLPFGGFYKSLSRTMLEPELDMKIYDDNILKQYGPAVNLAFLHDGISFKVQNDFLLGYDHETDRITIPQWNFNGELVGIMGRSNDPNIPYEYRWLPIIPCSRSYTLFGYHQNYACIQQNQRCIITESEKGVMQLASMGLGYGLATCTKNISKVQERYLKALRIEEIIIAYDQGVSRDELEREAQKIKINNPVYANKVGYIFDKDEDYLSKINKDSPTDLGLNTFKDLLQNYVYWI